MLTENRNLGIEVEYSGPHARDWWNTKIKSLTKKIGGITLWSNFEERHGMHGEWDYHLTYDGSVSGCGIELQTRPFSIYDKEYVDRFKDLMVGIRELGALIDVSCGLHVHISGADFTINNLRNLVSFYTRWQNILYSLVHTSRRSSGYCKSIPLSTAFLCTEALKIDTVSNLWSNLSRGTCLNLAPYFQHRHYEIRMGHGLLNPQRILNWASLHLHIAQFVINLKSEKLPLEKVEQVEVDKIKEMIELVGYEEAMEYFYEEYEEFK